MTYWGHNSGGSQDATSSGSQSAAAPPDQQATEDADFELVFRPLDLESIGVVTVTDAALGNVTENGHAEAPPMERIYRQAASLCLLADKDLLSGREGTFNLLDGRSHRLSRVCRSSYAAETYSLEEGVDSAEVVRGLIAECKGADLAVCRHDLSVIDSVPLVAVVDAKDTHDRCKSEPREHAE